MKRIFLFFCIVFCSTISKAQNYKAPPYAQDFEKWVNINGVKNVPDSHWVNNATIGNTSWRRNNDGASANWTNSLLGMYTPAAEHGFYSARLHGSQSTGLASNLDLCLNLSDTTYGGRPFSLSFDYFLPNLGDTLWLQISNNGLVGPFTTFRYYTTKSNFWQNDTATLKGVFSATTILRFKAKCAGSIDMGLDRVLVNNQKQFTSYVGFSGSLGPILKDTAVCPGARFRYSFTDGLRNLDNTIFKNINTAGWVYAWHLDTTSNLAAIGGNNMLSGFFNYQTKNNYLDTIIYKPFYIGLGSFEIYSYTNVSPVQLTLPAYISIRPWYECYCQADSAHGNDYFDVGNVKLELDSTNSPNFGTVLNNNPIGASDTFNNDEAVKFHSYFYNQLPKTLFKGNTYKITITNISQYPYSANFFAGNALYIDYNRDSLYNPTEIAGAQNVSAIGSSRYSTTFSFTVPTNAQLGKTGMRILSLNQQPASGISPCGNVLDYGEVEDYVVEIANYPCSNSLSAGTVIASDTIVCPGYNILLLDTNHAPINAYTGLSSNWQISNNKINWQNIPNASLDSITQSITQLIYLRYQLTCNGATINSNEVGIQLFNDGPCYPICYATGPDSADMGSLTIANYTNNTYGGGTHLNNPKAVRYYTSNLTTQQYLTLFADSTYNFQCYNILRSTTHADAQVSLLIDFDRDGNYNSNTELVFNDVCNTYLNKIITIPSNIVLNQNMGMRLVLNNDLGPNTPNDNGTGTFKSGEVEDYIIRFEDKSLLNLNRVANQQFKLWPTVSNGLFNLEILAQQTGKLQLEIFSTTGALIFNSTYNNPISNFKTQLNLAHLAKGVYYLKLKNSRFNATQKIVIE